MRQTRVRDSVCDRLYYGVHITDAATTPVLTIVPANESNWEDLHAVFGTGGESTRCQCQQFKIRHVEPARRSHCGT
jgi:hypothetical protein